MPTKRFQSLETHRKFFIFLIVLSLINFHSSVTPVLNIVQTFLNDDELYEAIISLPKTMEFIPLVTKIATHSKFKYIECNCTKMFFLEDSKNFKYLNIF